MRIRKVFKVGGSEGYVLDSAFENARKFALGGLLNPLGVEVHVIGEAENVERVRATAQKVARRMPMAKKNKADEAAAP